MQQPLWALPDPDLHGEFYADVPAKRLVAWAIDSVAIFALVILALPFTAFTALFFFPLFYIAIGLAYRAVSLARLSATPGMWLMALELRNGRGERADATLAFLHTLIYSISIAFVIPQIVSVAAMLTGPRAQGLNDIMLGSAVINRPAPG
ncbi:putative RDD family membrane protein YckC [Rhodovulum iodosum]|uniref:RDD family membrane protein YckC n=1 Tax=Rhodovulum iodosum TaxID=68291 RepID=A0ABV3XQR6_9RHOB|nr:RDD family protein [Rhodovulum robiginosum]RSK35855.1 RDD family protein [Rhodovulum robiginosum]